MERYNSEGNLIAKTEEGIQNFWKWFGDSKVVDEQGRPLVVYHGTNAGFDTFEKDRIGDFGKGYYFTTSRENAEQYATGKGGDIVMPVYLSIKNVYKAPGNAGQFLYNLRDKKTSTKQAQGVLLEQGFDGIEIKQFNGKEKYFVVFEPNQIKSVNNKGTFNPNSSNIYESTENKIKEYHTLKYLNEMSLLAGLKLYESIAIEGKEYNGATEQYDYIKVYKNPDLEWLSEEVAYQSYKFIYANKVLYVWKEDWMHSEVMNLLPDIHNTENVYCGAFEPNKVYIWSEISPNDDFNEACEIFESVFGDKLKIIYPNGYDWGQCA